MMVLGYNIFKSKGVYSNTYFFIKGSFWSSDFDTLEQLIDVGEQDPSSIINPKLNEYTIEELLEELNSDTNGSVIYLCNVKNLEDIEIEYPELLL